MTSWARTLTGGDTSAYFFDYPGASEVGNGFDPEMERKGARPVSPRQYYQNQDYHHTPTDATSRQGYLFVCLLF